jgi:hypothetical protein
VRRTPLYAVLLAGVAVASGYRLVSSAQDERQPAVPGSGVYAIFRSPLHADAKLAPGATLPAFDGQVTFVYPAYLAAPIDLKAITIRPPAPMRAWVERLHFITLKWQQTPGTRYTLELPSLSDDHGRSYPAISFPVSAGTPPPIPAPAPVPAGKSPSYYLGVFGPGNFGYRPGNGQAVVRIPNDPQNRMEIDEAQVYAIAAAFRSSAKTPRGYVRSVFQGTQVQQKGLDDDDSWGAPDLIASELGHEGVNDLTIFLEYGAPPSASYGGDGLYDSPLSFTKLCSNGARHIAATYPNVKYVELFNEPNNGGYWNGRAKAALYNPAYLKLDGSSAALYALPCYAAIKRELPRVTVVGPSLEEGEAGRESDARNFLQGMYDDGCRTGKCWDVLSVHPYYFADPADTVALKGCQDFAKPASLPARYPCTTHRWQLYQDLQRVAANNGDHAPGGGPIHVWLTEWSEATCTRGPIAPDYCYDPRVAAFYMAEFFNFVRADPSVDSVTWDYAYVDAPEDQYTGSRLYESDFTPKEPMLQTFRTFATSLGTAGDFAVPRYGPYRDLMLPLPIPPHPGVDPVKLPRGGTP